MIARLGAEVVAEASSAAEALSATMGAWLDVCEEPDVQRIVLLDAPGVLGWEEWREIGLRYALGEAMALLEAAMDAGDLAPPAGAPARARGRRRARRGGALRRRRPRTGRRRAPRTAGVLERLIAGLRWHASGGPARRTPSSTGSCASASREPLAVGVPRGPCRARAAGSARSAVRAPARGAARAAQTHAWCSPAAAGRRRSGAVRGGSRPRGRGQARARRPCRRRSSSSGPSSVSTRMQALRKAGWSSTSPTGSVS